MKPFETIALDFTGELPVTKKGHRYILVCIDLFSKWLDLKATTTVDSTVTARFLVRRVLRHHGCVGTVLSDQGSEFMGATFRATVALLRSSKQLAPAGHHNSNGAAERAIATVEHMLAGYTNRQANDWDEYLPLVEAAYNNTVHAATGETPFFLLHGFDAGLPIKRQLGDLEEEYGADAREFVAKRSQVWTQACEEAQMTLAKSATEYELRANKGVEAQHPTPGDRVWFWRDNRARGNKIRPRWTGPYRVRYTSRC
jgi:hypothetical protein